MYTEHSGDRNSKQPSVSSYVPGIVLNAFT